MIYNFWCLDCGNDYSLDILDNEIKSIKYQGLIFDGIKCQLCRGKAKLMGKQASAIVTGKCFTPVAVMEDNQGRQYEINNKGKILNNKKYENDQRGWKRAGKKKIRELDQYGKFNNR